MKNKHDLELDEVILLTALLLESGLSLQSIVKEFKEHFPNSPFAPLKIQNKSKSEGAALIQLAKTIRSANQKAFLAQLSVASLTGMTIGENLKWMAKAFQAQREVDHPAQKLTIFKKAGIDDFCSDLNKGPNEPENWAFVLKKSSMNSSFREVQVLRRSLPVFQKTHANFIEWANHFRSMVE